MADQMERRMIRFPQPMLDALAVRAGQNGRTVSAEIRLACGHWLESWETFDAVSRPRAAIARPTPDDPHALDAVRRSAAEEVTPRFKRGAKTSPGK